MNLAPLLFDWDGEGFKPLPRFAQYCDQELVIGERYRLEVIEERSAKTHRHYFAALKEAFDNLPDAVAQNFSDVESLRKFALCMTGYCNDFAIACASAAEARRTLVTVKNLDSFAVATIDGSIVRVRTAKSQSTKEMGKEAFQASKSAVLSYVAGMLGVTAGDLSQARAA